MSLKRSRHLTDLIFACVLSDALPRPAPDLNFEGSGCIWDPCWNPLDLHVGVWQPFFRQWLCC